MLQKESIDHGKAFDWGKTSADYAAYRDIYPKQFYQKLLDMNLCTQGQEVLDIGTGTGVLPRNLYRWGASFTGIDSAENQIIYAKRLAEAGQMKIPFLCIQAEASVFPPNTFDVVTACQCFPYFDHSALAPHLYNILKPRGKFVVLYMAWLPAEDKIAGGSEALVLKYNPAWTGCKEQRHPIKIPDVYNSYFELEEQVLFDLLVPFTRES